jgi:ribosomal protein S18 acetylase RimI-like enzyme
MIEIERASLEDLLAAVDLFERYRGFYRCVAARAEAERFLRERLAQGDSTIFLARDRAQAGEAVGFMQLYPLFSSTAMKKLWLLNDLFVAESHRRRGVGESLIQAALELARSTGARGIFLETEATNAQAQALYTRMGLTKNENHFYGLDLR